MKRLILIVLATGCLLCACHHNDYTPKPYAYLRIDLPETEYITVDSLPFSFERNTVAKTNLKKDSQNDVWVDIEYPSLNGVIFLTYKQIHGLDDLRGQIDTSSRFLEQHYQFTSGIEEQGYENPEHKVYGTVYYLKGNRVASTCQFWMTDSTHHFLRGALYLNSTPNNDSLAPVIDYMQADIEHLVETLRWTGSAEH